MSEPTPEERSLLRSIEADIARSGGILPNIQDALHLWMAATAAMEMLDARLVKEELRSRELPMADPEYVARRWLAVDVENDEEMQRWLDEIGDYAKTVLLELKTWLTARGTPNTKLIVFFPCHGSFGGLEFYADRLPVLTEW